jgi:glycosyltransferase involved in cell wall biosynthesis
MVQRALHVGVDARHLGGGRGVARYTSQLLDRLAREYPDDRLVLLAPADDPLGALPNVSLKRHPLPGRVLFGSAALSGRPRLDRLFGAHVDVVWIPAVAPVALTPSTPFVLTVHDTSFEQRPGDFTAYERLWHRLARPPQLARRARLVIVPSAPVRDELVRAWGLDEARVCVVPEGVYRTPPAPAAPGRYLLAVGALEPRKAPLLLRDAFTRAREKGLDADLVFAGEGRLRGQLAGTPGVRLLGRVSDDELDALYRGALALVVPSLLEGYGLPLREALARGTPAVVSDLPVFGPELSPAVLRVPPGDEAALTRALLELSTVRERLAAAAPSTVTGVTWTEAARRTRAILAEAAASGS